MIGASYAADRYKASTEEEEDTTSVPFTAAEIYAHLLKEKESKKQSDEDLKRSVEMKKILH